VNILTDMKKLTKIFLLAFLILACWMPGSGQTISMPSGNAMNFIVISDHGRNGYYNQKEVADMMARVAVDAKVRFYVTGGDNFQVSGVQSAQDPLWMSCFENIYTHPSSHYEWYPAFGNHDHGGNTQAQIDYSKISRRWKMPANYYTLVKKRDSVSVRLVILDTTPLMSAFEDSEPGPSLKDAQKQLVWVDSVLTVSKEDWTVVVGHHPMYSAHATRGNSIPLVEHLKPVLTKHNVDFFIGAHDHIFQHMKDSTSNIDYFVNTAASEVRPVASNKMTVFAASSPGFSICSATKSSLAMYFIDINGVAIYRYVRQKK
jgi:hypothetical protein